MWEHDVERRRPIIDREETLVTAIDDELSTEIVVQNADRNGKAMWPWLNRNLLP